MSARWSMPVEAALAACRPEPVGRVEAVVGLGVDVRGVPGAIGDAVLLGRDAAVPAEVVAVNGPTLRCMPLGIIAGLRAGDEVRSTRGPIRVPVGDGLLGRVIDGLGRPVDGRGPLGPHRRVELDRPAPAAMGRSRIRQPLQVGVRVLDTLATIGRGQRIGLFAGSGVGKSSLLSMIARGTDAAVSVIALIGERGREVREFLEDDLGQEGLARSVVVVATSDEPAAIRARAAFVATRIAESFRDDGRHAVLMMDSLTRVAMAQREIGLSAGEPPATRGYPPSTFSLLARLLERAGTDEHGSVTGVYTVLVDGDDHNEPIADAARSILDGHVVLDRGLSLVGHFPSVDALASVSRLAGKVTRPEDLEAAARLRRVLAARAAAGDLIDVGAYPAGSNPLVDAALAHEDDIRAFLCQRLDEPSSAEDAWSRLHLLDETLGRAA